MDLMPRRLKLKPPGDYPIDELPLLIQKVIWHIEATAQAKRGLVGPTVLSVMSASVQDGCNVRVNENILHPISTFTIIGSPSGSGKSVTANMTCEGLRATNASQQIKYAEANSVYSEDLKIWSIQDKDATKQYSKALKNGDDSEEYKQLIRRLQKEMPTPPLNRKLILNDITPASLKHELGRGNASFTILSDEGGLLLKTLLGETTTLNNIWSGGSIAMIRVNQPEVYVTNARVSMLVMVQTKRLLKHLSSVEGEVNRDNGFSGRCLYAIPESTQGMRTQVDTKKLNLDALNQFNSLVITMSEHGIERRKSNHDFHTIELSRAAFAFWSEMYEVIEFNMMPGEVLDKYQDAASRLLEHATRLAAIIEVFTRGHVEQVSLESMKAGYAIANWHLDHFIEIMRTETETDDASKAEILHEWLKKKVLFKGHIEIDRSYIRKCGPECIRNIKWLDDTLEILVSQGLVRVYKSGHTIKVKYIPAEYIHAHRNNIDTKLLPGAQCQPFTSWKGPLPFDLRDIEKVPSYRPWINPL